MPAPFTIRGSNDGDTARVHLGGELDLAARETLRSYVYTCLQDDTLHTVLIELTELTFIDSTGIGALIGCLRMADETGKSVRARGAQGRVADILDITGVTSVLAGSDRPETVAARDILQS